MSGPGSMASTPPTPPEAPPEAVPPLSSEPSDTSAAPTSAPQVAAPAARPTAQPTFSEARRASGREEERWGPGPDDRPVLPVGIDFVFGATRSRAAVLIVALAFAQTAMQLALFAGGWHRYASLGGALVALLPAMLTTQPFASPLTTAVAVVIVAASVYLDLPRYKDGFTVTVEGTPFGTWLLRGALGFSALCQLLQALWLVFVAGVQALRGAARVLHERAPGASFVMQGYASFDKGGHARRIRYTAWLLRAHRHKHRDHDDHHAHDGDGDAAAGAGEDVGTERPSLAAHEPLRPPRHLEVRELPTRVFAALGMSLGFAVQTLALLLTLCLAAHSRLLSWTNIMAWPDADDARLAEEQKLFTTAVNAFVTALGYNAAAPAGFAQLLLTFQLDTMVKVTYTVGTVLESTLSVGSYIGAAFAALLFVSSWAGLLSATYTTLQAMRTGGRPEQWRGRDVSAATADRFVGLMALSSALQMAQAFALALLSTACVRTAWVLWERERWLFLRAVTSVAVSAVAFVCRKVFERCFVIPATLDGARPVRPRLYILLSFILFVLGFVGAVAYYLVRAVGTLFVVMWNLGRPDIAAFPWWLTRLDLLHSAYAASLVVHHENTNPAALSLATALIADMHWARHARAHHDAVLDGLPTTLSVPAASINPVSPRSPVSPVAPAAGNSLVGESLPLLGPGSVDVEPVLDDDGPSSVPPPRCASPPAGLANARLLWQRDLDHLAGNTWSALPAVRVMVEAHVRIRAWRARVLRGLATEPGAYAALSTGQPAALEVDPCQPLLAPVPMPPESPADAVARRRLGRVQARFQLLALLCRNPSLRPLRKHRLSAVAESH